VKLTNDGEGGTSRGDGIGAGDEGEDESDISGSFIQLARNS
jgi:hypothetical protein